VSKKDKENKRVEGLRVQWGFLPIGTGVAILAGITVNALYDVMKIYWRPLQILIVYGLMLFVGTLFINFLFKNLQNPKYSTETPIRVLFCDFLKSVFITKK
jgi:hypothetical protein